MQRLIKISVITMSLALTACDNKEVVVQQESIRGLKTELVNMQENSSIRRYPSVLQPSESTTLSFQISGKMGENKLNVGEKVNAGDVLVALDKRALTLAVETAQAALDEANANAKNAKNELQRNKKLRVQGLVSQVALDNAETAAITSNAQAEQAKNQLATSNDNLSKSELIAPYDGIINSVSVRSFSTVAPGTTIATLYNPSGFEARFSVSYDIANRLVVGKPVTIRLADNPKIILSGQVSELASSTNTVSSYPVVIALKDIHPDLKAGMAVEVSMEFTVTESGGYSLPISALVIEAGADIAEDFDPLAPMDAAVFIYDSATQTVKKRQISIVGIRENKVILRAGVSAGDRIAVAGVSFLHEGQKVKLLADKN